MIRRNNQLYMKCVDRQVVLGNLRGLCVGDDCYVALLSK